MQACAITLWLPCASCCPFHLRLDLLNSNRLPFYFNALSAQATVEKAACTYRLALPALDFLLTFAPGRQCNTVKSSAKQQLQRCLLSPPACLAMHGWLLSLSAHLQGSSSQHMWLGRPWHSKCLLHLLACLDMQEWPSISLLSLQMAS